MKNPSSKQLQSKTKTKKPNINFDITKFTFRKDQLLVRAIRAESGDGKLIDPAQYEDKPEFGEIIKLGEKVEDLKVGQIVRFGKYSTELIRTRGQDYFIVHEEDISAYL